MATCTMTNGGSAVASCRLTCGTVGPVICTSLDKTNSGSLGPNGGSTTGTATYAVGNAGSGSLVLTAVGGNGSGGTVQDNGSFNVTGKPPPGAPVVDATPY